MTRDQGPGTRDEGQRTKDGATPSAFPGVLLTPLIFASDPRGWLTELFRSDELEAAGMKDAQPVMGYVSMTKSGVARGPHEHREQTDLMAFAGPSDFEVTLWDNRPGSPTLGQRETLVLGQSRPATLIIPPGVVHAYRNVGEVEGWVLNFANRLYRGPGRKNPVDEIRHEDDPNSPFKLSPRRSLGGQETVDR
ncbi:MAG: dTDP-4-dehydrorhamnose 3,5-epimerase family protein [candidate division WOR-3 bacterium]|nr:MAG: dTDP-4-dehydrorhamnose 3,5-epimerase family protein [candidate division WOR-3 bacterium]